MKVAIYPGSFDPITFGHMDIIDRASGLFDKIIIAIAKSETKNPLFSLEDRIKLANTIYKDNDKVDVIGFPRQLTVDVAKEHNACAIIRGLRAVSDFEYEFQIANINRSQNEKIEILEKRYMSVLELIKLMHCSDKYPQFNNSIITN